MTSEDRLSSPSIPGAVRVARLLLRIESAGWMFLGALLTVGGLIVLSGGSGLPGIVDDPVGDPPLGGWVVAAGMVIAVIASWGLWTGWSMRRLSRGAYVSALLFCGVWIVLGLLWVRIASTAIPGTVTIALNAVILVGLAAPPRSRTAFRGAH